MDTFINTSEKSTLFDLVFEPILDPNLLFGPLGLTILKIEAVTENRHKKVALEMANAETYGGFFHTDSSTQRVRIQFELNYKT